MNIMTDIITENGEDMPLKYSRVEDINTKLTIANSTWRLSNMQIATKKREGKKFL